MLYAIGDLHLSFEANKPMDVFGPLWSNHIERLEKGFSKLTDNDICVICGDLTWSMSLEKSLEDFKFIDKLPGKKIILKGNHDYWWTTASAAYKFFKKNNITTISILHNNCFFYKSSAICGTRGWFCEEEHGSANDRKIMNREIMRLERSLQAAGDCKEKLCFFHYPPLYNNYVCQEVIDTMKKYDVKSCWYGHIHGYAHKLAVTGRVDGINYSMVSADYVGFEPVLIE